jgi:DNA-binding NarL/FixJ family response regulator
MTVADVLVISPDPLLRTALPLALGSGEGPGVSVVAAADVGALAEPDPAPSVVLLDVDGIDADPAEWVATAAADGRNVLVLHSRDDVAVLVSCLEAGALGFQTKDLDLPGLVAALSAVSAGEAVVPRQMLGGLLRDLIDKRRQDDDRMRLYNALTRREREILVLLGRGQDQDGIARELVISPQTARTHIQNVLSKLEVHSRMEAVTFAHELGLVG